MTAQLPHDAHGDPLCRHVQAGRCTWWCSYRRAVLCIGPVVALMVTGGALRWMSGGDEARQQIGEAVGGVGLVLAVGVPAVLYANRASDRL